MWEDFVINMGVSALLIALKNPKKKEKLRQVFLKLFKAIQAAFSGDPDFVCK